MQARANQFKQIFFNPIEHTPFHDLYSLEINGSRDIGLQFSTCSLSPFLNTATKLAIFHSFGSIPKRSDLLNILQRDGAIVVEVALRSSAGISSGPVALLTSRVSSMDWTSATLSVTGTTKQL